MECTGRGELSRPTRVSVVDASCRNAVEPRPPRISRANETVDQSRREIDLTIPPTEMVSGRSPAAFLRNVCTISQHMGMPTIMPELVFHWAMTIFMAINACDRLYLARKPPTVTRF